MELILKRLSATMCSHSSVPRIASYLHGSLLRYWRSIALYTRVIGALLLFASAEFAVAQDVATEAISGTFANAPAGVETINGYQWIGSYTGGTSNDFVLTAVPEAGTWVAGGLALGGLICYQRRRFARFFKRGP